ncbi:MAG: hypothetical protein ABGX27_05330 [Desulfurobacteriaceae bacterium]
MTELGISDSNYTYYKNAGTNVNTVARRLVGDTTSYASKLATTSTDDYDSKIKQFKERADQTFYDMYINPNGLRKAVFNNKVDTRIEALKGDMTVVSTTQQADTSSLKFVGYFFENIAGDGNIHIYFKDGSGNVRDLGAVTYIRGKGYLWYMAKVAIGVKPLGTFYSQYRKFCASKDPTKEDLVITGYCSSYSAIDGSCEHITWSAPSCPEGYVETTSTKSYNVEDRGGSGSYIISTSITTPSGNILPVKVYQSLWGGRVEVCGYTVGTLPDHGDDYSDTLVYYDPVEGVWKGGGAESRVNFGVSGKNLYFDCNGHSYMVLSGKIIEIN